MIEETIEKYINEESAYVSATISMPKYLFKELEAEIGIKTTMGQLNPKMSMMEKMAIFYVVGVKKGDKLIKFKDKGGSK